MGLNWVSGWKPLQWVPVSWREHHAFASILLLLATMGMFALFKLLGLFSGADPSGELPLLLILLAAGWKLHIADSSPAFRLLLRAVLLLFTFYVMMSYVSLTEHVLQPWSYQWFLMHWGRVLAAVCGLIGLFRPAFGLVLLTYVAWFKNELSAMNGLFISKTDYFSVIEFGVFMIMGMIVAQNWRPLRTMLDKAAAANIPEKLKLSATDALVLGAIAVHFANYFFSAYQKFMLDGGMLSWVLENNTHNVMMISTVGGFVPLMISDALTRYGHLAVSEIVLFINIFTIAGQALAIVALKRIRWAIAITLFYDLTHVTIFLVSGIFFWKWIFLNFAIVAALTMLRHKRISWPLYATLAAMLVVSPKIFFVTFLGWYDSSSLNHAYVKAVMKDGTVYTVPSNYFLTNSVSFAQMQVGAPYAGHFPNHLAATTDSDIWRKGDACALPVDPTKFFLRDERNARIVEQAVLEPHFYILDNASLNGRYYYDLFPHHIWSNPLYYKSFAYADKRDILKFIFVVESICVSIDKFGNVQKDVKHRSSYDIPVDRKRLIER